MGTIRVSPLVFDSVRILSGYVTDFFEHMIMSSHILSAYTIHTNSFSITPSIPTS